MGSDITDPAIKPLKWAFRETGEIVSEFTNPLLEGLTPDIKQPETPEKPKTPSAADATAKTRKQRAARATATGRDDFISAGGIGFGNTASVGGFNPLG